MKTNIFSRLSLVLLNAVFLSSGDCAPYAVAVRQVNLNGYNFFCDSFNSSDTNLSTGGLYDPLKASDGANVASQDGILNANNVANVEIWGRLQTGSPFILDLGPFGSVGSVAWHQAGQFGIEPSFHDTNFAWVFPDVPPPFSAGLVPAPGVVNGVYYNYVFYGDGNYQLTSLTLSGSQKALVMGFTRLLVTESVSLSGNAYIRVLPAGRLDLYVAGATANLRGGGIINEGLTRSFNYFGMPGNTAVNLRVSTPFVGNVYVPAGSCTITSSGSSTAELFGAIAGRALELGAPVRLHLDEAVGQ
jgi:hypothetical protein